MGRMVAPTSNCCCKDQTNFNSFKILSTGSGAGTVQAFTGLYLNMWWSGWMGGRSWVWRWEKWAIDTWNQQRSLKPHVTDSANWIISSKFQIFGHLYVEAFYTTLKANLMYLETEYSITHYGYIFKSIHTETVDILQLENIWVPSCARHSARH